MGSLAGFLQLTDPATGRCVELINGARTVSHLRAGRASNVWRETESAKRWPGTDCWAFDAGNYEDGSNPDPWFDAVNPATEECAGFLPDPPGAGLGFRLEQATSTRTVTSAGQVPYEMFLTGTVVASTQRGEQAYLDWLQRVLADRCADGRGWLATVFAHCPCEADLAPYIDLDGFTAPVVDAQAPADPDGVCDPNPPDLDPFSGLVPERIDDGVRHLLRVRYRGMDELQDQPTFTECAGRRFQIRFEVDHPAWFTRPQSLGSLGGSSAFDLCETLTAPFRICPGAAAQDNGCAPVDTFTRRRRTSLQRAQFIQPRCFMRDVLLTPPQTFSATRLHATLTNGAEDVHNVALKVWRAIDGVPSPASELGHKMYRQIEPVWEALIPKMGRDTKLVLDGRTNRAVMTCADGTTLSGPGLVEASNGGAWRPQALSCGDRYWVALDISADERSRGALDTTATLDTFVEELYS